MANSDPIRNPDEIKFKFCGSCGRLLPATLLYFNKNKNSNGKVTLYSFCKKCQYNKKRACEEKRREHYAAYQREWKIKKRQEYLESIGLTEEIINQKKRGISPHQRKNRLEKKAVKNPKKIRGKKRPAEIDIFGNKKCRHCKQWKPNNEDQYRMRTDLATPSLDRICRECRLNWHNKNRNKLARYSSKIFKTLSLFEETRKDPQNKNLGQCRCAYCGKWVNPTNSAVNSRITAFNNLCQGENRIYCKGDQCRTACPTYGQQLYPKGFKVNSSREVDPAIRIMCLERDNWTCQKCGKNDNNTTLHAHHILSYKKNIMLANDIENVITLCKNCHNDVHMKAGCRYHELKCG